MNDAISTALVLLMGLGLTLAGALVLSTRQTLRSRLRRTPRTLAREARAGSVVKMVGKVVVREPVHAPLANVDCAWFQMTVQEVLHEEKETHETLFSEKEYANGWELEDESGRIEVQPDGAEFQYIRLREFVPGGAAWEPGIRQDLLSRYLTSSPGSSDTCTRLREERLDLGTTVVALGRVDEGPRGPVLTGGAGLLLLGETEKELTAFKASDLLAWAMLVTGLLLCAAWVSQLGREPESIPGTEPIPIQIPAQPSRPPPHGK